MQGERDHDALLRSAVSASLLPGLSGAKVYLVTYDKRRWFVRKAAKSPEGSERLRQQIEKQRRFSLAVSGVLKTPSILDEGEHDGRYYADMEYIHGLDGVSFLRAAAYRDITRFADRLCAYLHAAAALSPVVTREGGLYESMRKRIQDVERRIGGGRADVFAPLLRCLEPLRGLRPTSTLCHGDLTLQNLIVDESGAIWALDLLDSPYEHYWLDVAKLHQDLSGDWYRLHQSRIGLGVVQYVGRRVLSAAMRINEAYGGVHNVLVACHFARILPYLTDGHEIDFVIERIGYFVQLALTQTPVL
jgi:aminoglycoside phosphotransferase